MTTASSMAITSGSGPALDFFPRDLSEQHCTCDRWFLWSAHTHTCACDHAWLPTRHLMEHLPVHAGCRGAENGTLLRHSSFREAIMSILVSTYCVITILSFVLAFFFKGHLIRSNKLLHQTKVYQFVNISDSSM